MPYNGLKHTYNHINLRYALATNIPVPSSYPLVFPRCSGANIFTCYSGLLNKVVPKDIIVNGFADDHSLRKSFPASDLKKQKSTQTKLEHNLAGIKSRMDTMRLRLNTNKTEYITFGSRAQLLKISTTPLTTFNDRIQITHDVKYLGGTLDSELKFNKDITMKIRKAVSNFICIKSIWKYLTKQTCTTLVLSLCILHLDYGNALQYGLPKIHKHTTDSSEHMCQACTATLIVPQHNTGTYGPSLASS